MSLPPLYACEHCQLEIKPDAPNTHRLVRGWVRGSTKTITVVAEEYRYVHSFCFDLYLKDGNIQDSLF